MAQGKLKLKAKLPQNAKSNRKQVKGSAVTKRANRPIQPKKKKSEQTRKLREIVTKAVNKTVEEEIRAKASNSGKQILSKAQLAVAQHHSKSSSSAK